MKSNLFQLIESQTHFGTSWHAMMSLITNATIEYSSLKPPHYLKHAPKTYRTPNMEAVVCETNQIPTKGHVE
jgi:hypothetical protein